MIRTGILAMAMSFLSLISFAQNSAIRGSIMDKTSRRPVSGASVTLSLQSDSSLIKTVLTDSAGRFSLLSLAPDSFILKVSSVGYQEYISFITLNEEERELDTIGLDQQGKDLGVVTVVSRVPPVVQKGDTSQFSASQYKVNPDATTEDLIKKMPGITVDKDGTVTAQGEQVRKVTIDGKDFFGDDASAALKNLPSEVVDKIQVFDRLSDQAQLTGFDDGNSVKSINVVTKSGIKNGQFGRIYAGYGTDDRYNAGGNVSFFKGNRRISVVGNFNNINQQNFASQDLLGLTSSNNTRGGGGGGFRGGSSGGGGGGFRGGGGADNFSVGQASGISRTNAIGINFGNKWGEKLNVTGSYFFNNSRNINESVVKTETFFNPKNQFTDQVSNTVTNNYNHRISMRLEYKIDSNNSLFILPNINFQKNNSDAGAVIKNYYGINDSLNTSLSNIMSDRNGYNVRNNIMYRHSFAKKGRSITLGFNTVFTKNDGETINDVSYRFFENGTTYDSLQNQFTDNTTNGRTIGGTVAYTEPVGKKGQIQIDYNPSVQKNKADQETFLFDGSKYTEFDSTLSNKFDNTITTNNAGVSYRFSQNRDNMFSLGVNFQNSRLESERLFPRPGNVDQSFSNFLPNAMWRMKFSASSNVRLFYRASTNFPTVTQLQDVPIISPLRVSIGNPELKQAYTHFVSGRYTYTNSKTSKSFFANIFFQTAGDYISNAIFSPQGDSILQPGVTVKSGSQLSKPVNLDGYRNIRTFFTYSMPVKAIKTTVNVSAGLGYSRLPGLSNYITTITDNYTYNGGIVLASNISQYVDFNISYNANFNDAKTSGVFISNNKYVNQALGVNFNLLNKKGWFIQNDISYQAYNGLSAGLNQDYTLWNAGIGKKFLKNQAGELKLSVFDLLKQNQSISRVVTENYIQDSQSRVLQQYFMLTFTYNLKNFGTMAKAKSEESRRGAMERPPGNSPAF